MGDFIPAAKTLRIVHTDLDEDGHTGQIRFYLTYDGAAPSASNLTAMAGAVESSWGTNIQPLQHTQWDSQGTIITDLTSTTSAQGSVGGTGGGSLAGGRLPASTCGVVSQTSTRRIRGGHSRVYLPVGDDTKILTGALWNTTFVSAFQVAYAAVISDAAAAAWAGAGTLSQTAPSFFQGFTNVPYGSPEKFRRVPTPRGTAELFAVITLEGKQLIGTQRRRLRA